MTLKLPDIILQQIQMHCETNNIAMAMMGSDDAGVCMLLLGRRSMSPDQASVIAAAILLNGVITGSFDADNAKLNEQRDKSIPKDKVN